MPIVCMTAVPNYIFFSRSTLSFLIPMSFVTHALDLPWMPFPSLSVWWCPTHSSRDSSRGYSVKASQNYPKSIHHRFFLCVVSCSFIIILKFHTYFFLLFYVFQMTFCLVFNYQCIPIISNKKKVDFRCPPFKAQWIMDNFVFELDSKVFITYFYYIALLKEYSICGQTKFWLWYSRLTGKQWTEKLKNFKWNSSSQQNFLKKWNQG